MTLRLPEKTCKRKVTKDLLQHSMYKGGIYHGKLQTGRKKVGNCSCRKYAINRREIKTKPERRAGRSQDSSVRVSGLCGLLHSGERGTGLHSVPDSSKLERETSSMCMREYNRYQRKRRERKPRGYRKTQTFL